uniref:G_PROTEIN_RECEP_F1_2 domain-containing protein n=1 Tax=Rhabditophanes sp. KR3021 TaxID=114890 RepID=A0AC35U032_9BILA
MLFNDSTTPLTDGGVEALLGVGSYILIIAMAFLSIVTILGNVVVLLSYYLEKNIRQPSNYFIFSLAVSDLIIGLEGFPVFTYVVLNDNKWHFGEVLCYIWLSVDYSVCLASIYTVLGITIDRFCSVKYPAIYRNWRTPSKVYIIIILIWVVPSVLFSVSIFGYETFTGTKRPPDSTECMVPFMTDPYVNMTMYISYYWSTLALMLGLYYGIYRAAKQLSAKSEQRQGRIALVAEMKRNCHVRPATDISTTLPAYSEAGFSNSILDSQPDTSDSAYSRSHTLSSVNASSAYAVTKISPDLIESNNHCSMISTPLNNTETKVVLQTYLNNISNYNNNNSITGSKLSPSPTPVPSSVDNDSSESSGGEKPLSSQTIDILQAFMIPDDQIPFIDDEIRSLHSRNASKKSLCRRNQFQLSLTRSNFSLLLSSSSVTPPPCPVEASEVEELIKSTFTNTLPPKRHPHETGPVFKSLLDSSPHLEQPPSNNWNVSTTLKSKPHSVRSKLHRTSTRRLRKVPKAAPTKNDGGRAEVRRPLINFTQTQFYKISLQGSNFNPATSLQRFFTLIRRPRVPSTFASSRTSRSTVPIQAASRSENRARKALRTITVILGSFMILWTPFYVLATIYGFCDSCKKSPSFNLLYSISYYFCYMNSPINPFCYAMANQQFKKTFKRILRFDFRRT